jgi:hypothetical protein
MLKFLSDNGLTPVVLVGFVMTIVSSFLSARWGGAESRRQYRDTAQTDRRSAAAEMIPLLIEFADECDRRKGSLSPPSLRPLAALPGSCPNQFALELGAPRTGFRSRLPRLLLENPLHHAGADAEFSADLENAVAFSP